MMSLAWLSMLLPGPLSEPKDIPLFWPLFSSSSHFQSEPLVVPLTPTLTLSTNILRLSDLLPGVCLHYYRSPSIRPLSPSFTQFLPVSSCFCLLPETSNTEA